MVHWFQSKVAAEASTSSEMNVASEVSTSSEMKVAAEVSGCSEMVCQSVVDHSEQQRDPCELANWDQEHQEHVDWMQQMMQAPLDNPTNVHTQMMQPISNAEAEHCRELGLAEFELAANIRASLEATAIKDDYHESIVKNQLAASKLEAERCYEELVERDLAELSLVADQNAALLVAEEEAEVSSQPS